MIAHFQRRHLSQVAQMQASDDSCEGGASDEALWKQNLRPQAATTLTSKAGYRGGVSVGPEWPE